jgi:glycosyltransferase involved in cell wall biosynthesis
MKFPGRLALQQRVLPAYRASFFEMLEKACDGGLSILAGQPLSKEGIASSAHLDITDLRKTRNHHFRDPQSSLYLCWQTGVIRWLKDTNPDALIVEANPRYMSTNRAIHWMKTRGKLVLGWGLGAPRGGNLLERILRMKFLHSLDGIIAYSGRGADEYRVLGLKTVFVAHNAVSQRPMEHPPERSPEFGKKPVVLFVGRIQERKRIDILLHACASLTIEIQPRLILVGDGPARSKFQSLAKDIYPLAEFVGAKHGAELAPYFAAADLFALPGTGGLAVQQAMTHGLPVIVAQGDGTQDDLVRPENGWQVPPGEQDGFKDALETALSDITRLRKMGEESYRIVSEEINLEAMVASFVSALNDLSSKNVK